MTCHEKMTRRDVMALLGGATAAGLGAGCSRQNREDVMRALDADAEDTDPVQVMRRPVPFDPSREISLLGYGGTRLPTRGRDKNNVDRELGAKLVDFAYRHGLNYFDTGWNYHEGNGERFWGATLSKYPRESFFLSDKMCTWRLKKETDGPEMFAEQMKRCAVEYFDFYLCHSVGSYGTFQHSYIKLGTLDFMREQKRLGRIRHLGMSYHGQSKDLPRILDEYPECEMCILLVNAYEGRRNPDNLKMREILRERKVAIVVMEPLAGGRLSTMHGRARELLKEAAPDDTPAKWGYRYAASQPGVMSVLTGMGHFAYVRENVRTLSTREFKPFSAEEAAVYEKAVAAFMEVPTIACTGCRYCTPCPYGVPIPDLFAWYNKIALTGLPPEGDVPDAQRKRRDVLVSYFNTFSEGHRAHNCIGCRKCSAACPQWTLRIPEELTKLAAFVGKTRDAYLAAGGRLRGKGPLPC